MADGSKLTFAEAVSLVRALIIAGNDTTATAIGNLLFLLSKQSELAKKLYENIDDDRFVTRFVEELLRSAPPVRGLDKMTTRETTLGGQKLPNGAHMLVMVDFQLFPDGANFECPF